MADNAFVKIGTALLKHQVKKLVGEEAMGALGAELADIGGDKLDAWLGDKSTIEELEKAAKTAETCFHDVVEDHELEQWMVSLPIGDLPKVLEAIEKLPTSPDEKQLEDAIRESVAGWRKLSPEQTDKAVNSFLSCLRSALLPIEKQTLMVIGHSVLRTEDKVNVLIRWFEQYIITGKISEIEQLNPKPLVNDITTILRPEEINHNSYLYLERESDHLLISAIKRDDITIVIKGPKKMGKTCLLKKASEIAKASHSKVIYLDFKLFEEETLNSSDSFYKQFCGLISSKLGLINTVEEYWKIPLGNTQRCTMYFEAVLNSAGDTILAMEDVDKVFLSPFKTDFFSMLRSWHESRRQDSPWKHFGLILVTSTEPYLYIKDPSRSPFNVGTIIELEDFDAKEISEINQRFGSPLSSDEEVQLMELLHGYPYLIVKALFLLRTEQVSFSELLAHAVDEHGPFSEHLREQLNSLISSDELAVALRQSILSNSCPNEWIFYKLHRAGLVRSEGTAIVPRCKLYADYFRIHLHEK